MPTIKRCCYLDCTSDGRFSSKQFIHFPQPWRDRHKCERWVRACGRPDFTADDVHRFTYICPKHFVGGDGPTLEHPDPIPALGEVRSTLSLTGGFEHSTEPPGTETGDGSNGVQKQMKQLAFHDRNWDPKYSNRETRKLTYKINGQGSRRHVVHDENGLLARHDEKDLCDCLSDLCPGCHFPCHKCGSPMCGAECRCNRKWTYDEIEVDGSQERWRHPYK